MPSREELGLTSRTKKLLEKQIERPKERAFGETEIIDARIAHLVYISNPDFVAAVKSE